MTKTAIKFTRVRLSCLYVRSNPLVSYKLLGIVNLDEKYFSGRFFNDAHCVEGKQSQVPSLPCWTGPLPSDSM